MKNRYKFYTSMGTCSAYNISRSMCGLCLFKLFSVFDVWYFCFNMLDVIEKSLERSNPLNPNNGFFVFVKISDMGL